MNNYFKARTTAAHPIDLCIPFNDADEVDTLRAWLAASDMAIATKSAGVCAWRRPQHAGPWRDCEVVT